MRTIIAIVVAVLCTTGGFDSSLLFATFLVAGICVKPILTHLYYAMLCQKKLLHPGLDKILEVKHVIKHCIVKKSRFLSDSCQG